MPEEPQCYQNTNHCYKFKLFSTSHLTSKSVLLAISTYTPATLMVWAFGYCGNIASAFSLY